MTNDVTALIQVLSDYHDTLVAQYQRVGEGHTELATRYHALSQVYDGRGAAQFKVEWQHVIICAGRQGGEWVYDSHTTAYRRETLDRWYPEHFTEMRFCHIAGSVSYSAAE